MKRLKNICSQLNTFARDQAPNISVDGLTLYFTTDGRGGLGDLDLHRATRIQVGAPWDHVESLGPLVNSSTVDAAPSVSSDGLALYFHSDRFGGVGSRDLWVALRDSKEEDFSSVQNVTGPNSAAGEFGPDISSDGLTLFLADGFVPRAGGHGQQDIWVTTRDSLISPFDVAVNLNDFAGGLPINTVAIESSPDLSPGWPANGTKLYFSSNRPGGMGGQDLWEATWVIDEPRSLRGDCNEDGDVDISDGVCILNWLFLGAVAPVCEAVVNTNGDGETNVADPTFLFNFLFLGGSPPAAPFPDCGPVEGCHDDSESCT